MFRHPTPQRLRRAAVACSAAVAVGAFAPSAELQTPPAYATLAHEQLAEGIEHIRLSGGQPRQAVHVARIAPDAAFELRGLLSGDAVPGRLERTSSMCRRTGCLLAVNGDFWTPGTGEPVGGLVSEGRLLRSPAEDHGQVVVSRTGALTTQPMRWKGRILSTDIRSLTFRALNVPLGDHITMYTPAFGALTPTSADAVELVLEILRPAGGPRLGQTSLVRMTGVRSGAGQTPIPQDGAVLAARGDPVAELTDLWARVESGEASAEALMRLDSNLDPLVSVGGSPVLIRDGRPVQHDAPTSFLRSRHPRTIVGRTAAGEILLVTVDGRQPDFSEGVSIAEATDLMLELGAVEAINLDGGGSTTFVVRGEVVNRPSDRLVGRGGDQAIVPAAADRAALAHVERPVAGALALVPKGAEEQSPALALGTLGLPETVALHGAQAVDPASDPTGHLPAVVLHTSAGGLPWWMLVAAAAAGLAVVLAVWQHHGVRGRLSRWIAP